MTSYMYTLRLGDSEIIMLQSALKLMINHCEENLKDGPKAPYWAHKHAALNVLDKLFEDTNQAVERIKSLMNDKIAAQKAGIAANQFANSRFSEELFMQKHLDLYESLNR